MKTFSLLFSVPLLAVLLGFCQAQAAAPSVATTNSGDVTTNSATLRGSVNPNGLTTVAFFEWGISANYGATTATQSLASGSVAVPVHAPLSGLTRDTTYHYRLVASSAVGITYGGDRIVTATELLTLEEGESWIHQFHDLPYAFGLYSPGYSYSRFSFAVLTNSFLPGSSLRWELFETDTNTTISSGVLNWPESGTSINLGIGFIVPWQDLQGMIRLTMLTGSAVVSTIGVEVGLQRGHGTMDIYRHGFAPVEVALPVIVTQFVSQVGFQSATVEASINARGLPAGVYLQWGATTNYGQITGPIFLDYDYVVSRQLTLSNLTPGTTYHLRTAATNSAGASYGADLTIATPSATITRPASDRTTISATLNATVMASGFNMTAYFEWGTTTNYGQTTPLQNVGNPITQVEVSAPLSGLSPIMTYHYRAVVYGAAFTNRGEDVVFRTTPAPTNTVVTNLATTDVRGAIERGGTVTFACDGVLTLSNEIEVANDVVLDSSGHSIALSGGGVTRIFKVFPAVTLILTNLTLADGRSTEGGAVLNQGIIKAAKCWFTNNAAIANPGSAGTNGPAGIVTSTMPGPPAPTGGMGFKGSSGTAGVILNLGSLYLDHCVFDMNAVLGGAGGAGGSGGPGGAYCPNGSGSCHGQDGGQGGIGGIGGDAQGGCIYNTGWFLMVDCTFARSLAVSGSGGVGGNGARAGQDASPFSRRNGNGGAGGNSGTAKGGVVFNGGIGIASNCTFVSNISRGGSGGQGGQGLTLFAIPSGPGAGGLGGFSFGGVLYNTGNWLSVNCTFATNGANGGTGGSGAFCISGGQGGSAWGGGIANDGLGTMRNNTLCNNTAGAGSGGVISNASCGSSTGPNGFAYGGNIANQTGTLSVVNSIIAFGSSNNCYGVLTDLGHNLSSDNTPAWSSETSTNNLDPLLSPFANNGGPTLTMALRVGSPALNNADPATSPARDQRGYPRPRGPGYDIGAYEGGVPPLQISRQSSATNALRWMAEANQIYRLEESTNLGAWTPAATNFAQSNGWYELQIPINPSGHYFRLIGE